jgi:hypothetical protein
VLYAYAHQAEIKGLRQLEDPRKSKYEPPHFTPL